MQKILSLDEVSGLTRYSRTSIYRMERAKQFPARIRLGPKKVGWFESEVEAWMSERPRGLAANWRVPSPASCL